MLRCYKKNSLFFLLVVALLAIFLILFRLNYRNEKDSVSTKIRENRENRINSPKSGIFQTQTGTSVQEETYSYFASFPAEMVTSQTAINEVKGRIESVGKSDNAVLKSGLTSKLTITLLPLNSPNSTPKSIFFNENNLKNIKVFSQTENKQIGYNDLKAGDDIIIREVLDLTKPLSESRSQIVITRI